MQVVGDQVEEMSLAADEVKDTQQQEMRRVNIQLQRKRRVATPL